MGQNFLHALRGITSGVKPGSRVAALLPRMIRSRDLEPMIDLLKTILATECDILNSEENLLLNIHAINIVSSRKFSRQIDQLTSLLDHIFYRSLILKSAAALLHVRSSEHTPLRVEFEHQPTKGA